MKAKDFDRGFDAGEDVTGQLDHSRAKRSRARRVNVDFPAWMVESLDREARHLGVTRQAIIKVWLAERLQHQPANEDGQTQPDDQETTE